MGHEQNNAPDEPKKEEAKLEQLERDEHNIATKTYHGFGDAIRRIRLEDKISAAETETIEEKERIANDRS